MKPSIESEEYKNAISVSRMRRSDEYTIKNLVSSAELMYRAAMGIYNSVEWNESKVAIVCGSGNNAGDGYALAGILADNGVIPCVFKLSEKMSDDGEFYFKLLEKKGVKVCGFTHDADFSKFDIIVDCIFGTGFRGEPKGITAVAINKINESGKYIVCADINSGLNGDTGEAVLAVKSNLTVSIGFYKKGMFINDAIELIEDLINIDIGIVLID